MTQEARPFKLAWLVVGVVALVVYVALPAVVLVGSDGEMWWLNGAWVVPSVVVAVGLFLGVRRQGPVGPIIVLVGALLLSFTTMLYFMMLLAAHMVGCQLALVILGVVGLTGPGRSRWGFAVWTLVLAVPVLVGAVAGVWALYAIDSGGQGVEFPIAQGVRFDFQGPGPGEGSEALEALPEGSAVEAEPGPQFVGVEAVPWEGRGRFEASVAEAMRTYRSALEADGWSVTQGQVGDVLVARKSDLEARLEFQPAEAVGAGGGTVVITLVRP